MLGETVTCDDSGDYCVDTGVHDTVTGECTWTRKLCLICETVGSRIKIHVQSNGLPRKCFYAPDRHIVAQNIEYSVLFNKKYHESDSEYIDVGLDEDKFDDAVCDWTKAMDSSINYELQFERPVGTASLDQASGIAIDGVPFYRAVTMDYEVDPFYPTDYT